MIIVAVVLTFIFLVLLVNEWLWRNKIIKGELARKLVHLTIGTFGAFWPFFMSWGQVQFVTFLAVGAIIFMRITKLFSSVYDIKRHSWGDLIAPSTIGLLALAQPPTWIFAVAVLHISLADGFAAIIGSKYGKHNHYKVLWNNKSVAGTFAFWIVSFSILSWLLVAGPLDFGGFSLPILLWLPLIAAGLENISPHGSDNFFVPVLIAGTLGSMQFLY